MKTLRLFTAAVFFAAIFSVSAFAQTGATKIGVIDTGAFDSNKPGEGITKYVNGMNTLETEFKTVQSEIQTMVTRYQTLGEEIKKLQAQASDPNNKVPLNPTVVQGKVDEYQKLERDIKFKQEDAKARYQSRYNSVMGPIMQDIGKAMQDFAKQKGYALILDGAKLDEAGLVLGIGDDKINATKDFIVFYNARPAGTATTAVPK
jgi:Skp family chaperone for outer membrane proteins